MAKEFMVYKGLQKPLIYKGFKGKFIYWGLGIVLGSLVIGSVSMAILNMYFGAVLMISLLIGGFALLAIKQKQGLYNKNRFPGIFVHGSQFKKLNGYVKKESI